jgi:hypothetical protein
MEAFGAAAVAVEDEDERQLRLRRRRGHRRPHEDVRARRARDVDGAGLRAGLRARIGDAGKQRALPFDLVEARRLLLAAPAERERGGG